MEACQRHRGRNSSIKLQPRAKECGFISLMVTGSGYLHKNKMTAERWTDTGYALHLRSADTVLTGG